MFRALSQINYNLKIYEAGDIVPLPEEEARKLIPLGVLEEIADSEEESPVDTPTEEPVGKQIDFKRLRLGELKALAEKRGIKDEELKTRADFIEALESEPEEESEE